MKSPAVSMRNVSFAYGRGLDPVVAIRGIDVQQGSVAAILGSNGTGKTTLLYLLLGLYRLDQGDLAFFGHPQSAYPRERFKRLVGMVSQGESIPFDLSVEEYVVLGRAPHLNLLQLPGAQDRAAATEALETVGMSHMATAYVTRLSSGERQLVNVARVLAQAPEILLLDEPCSHLDLVNSRRMLRLMHTIAEKGRTVLFTTHDPNAASAVADQVLLVRRGEIVADGPPEQTLNSELLTRTYGDAVEVIDTARGPVVLAT